MSFQRLLILSALAVLFFGSGLQAQESTRFFENGNDQLVVYADVPGLDQPEEHFRIRVRSNASNNEWQVCFGLVTRSLYEYSNENYFSILEGWTHTYTNIEMNSPVEVEIAKADGSPITKAAVHPHAKGSAVTIADGKAYFTMDQPALIAVDIDGQMDDQDTGRDQFKQPYDGPPIHAVSIFANPIFEKPDSTESGVKVVHPGEDPPTDPGTFKTVYFAPGVHNIGKDYQLHKNKAYYIPGDAIVYGTMGNHDQDNGMNIHIYGVGTISGDSLKHPEFDPDFPGYPDADADPVSGRPWKPISILDSEYTLVEGVCLANPAFHALSLPTNVKGEKVTTVRWAKVISWRGNGDGIGNPHIVEDCFLRTQDDATYVKGDRRRCVIWNDANGAAFVMSSIPDDFPVLVEDCDVIYSRASWHLWSGGRVFSGRPINGSGEKQVNVLFKDIRIEDKRPTLQIFYILSKNDISTALLGNPNGAIGSSWSGIKFQNIVAEGASVVGHPEIFHGCVESPYSDWTFDSVFIDGKLLTSLADFAEVNEYVTDITFNPGTINDASLFDIRLDGVSLPDFVSTRETYAVDFPIGTADVPVVTATQMDYGANVTILQAEGVPGTATITVTAEDGVTIKTYTLNFTTEGSDELLSMEVPPEFSPGDTITVSVTYAAAASRDIQVLLKAENDNDTKYGENRVTVPPGTGTVDITLIVSADTPLAMDAYKVTVNLLPEGGNYSGVLDIMKIYSLDLVSPYSSDVTLSDLTINGSKVQGFDPGLTAYDIILPSGTVNVPIVDLTTTHPGAFFEINDATELPGRTTVFVTAEDSLTTQTYTLNFNLEEITILSAPPSVMPGEKCHISVAYAAAFTRDVMVRLEPNDSQGTSFGDTTVTISPGTGSSDIAFIVDVEIPLAESAYALYMGLLPHEGEWGDRLVTHTWDNIDAVAPPSDDATLSQLTYNGLPVPGFDPGVLSYEIELPPGTIEVPDVEAVPSDTTAQTECTRAEDLPGIISILVTAGDGETTITYTLNFVVAIPDEITEIVAPEEVSPGDTIMVRVSYSAYTDRDIFVMIHKSDDPPVIFGGSTITVNMGTGSIDIVLIIGNDIPIADDAYTISASLLPVGASVDESLYTAGMDEIDAIFPTDISDPLLGKMDGFGIFVYPNPFSGDLHIRNNTKSHYSIYSIQGQKIFESQKENMSEATDISAHNWTNGIYILVAESGIVYKLIKY